MSSSFAFVPRTLPRDRRKPVQNVHPNRSAPILTPTVSSRGTDKASGGTDGKVRYSDKDYANVICIAISDYALWSDPDLRRTVDWSTASQSDQQANDGCEWDRCYLTTRSLIGFTKSSLLVTFSIRPNFWLPSDSRILRR